MPLTCFTRLWIADHVLLNKHTDGGGLAILLNSDTFLPDAATFSIAEPVRGMLRRPAVGASTTLTSCSVNVHNVPKKRDAATSPLQRVHAHKIRLDVDVIGGDFNMEVNGLVFVVFSDAAFSPLGSSPL